MPLSTTPTNSRYDRQLYFARPDSPPSEVAERSLDYVERYRDYLRTSGLAALWSRMHRAYHGGVEYRGRVRRAGKQGQYHLLPVNHFRNLIKHLHVMTTGQRPNFEAQAQNDDKASLSQAELAQGLLGYYLRVKGLERHFKAAAELALVFGEGWLSAGWDPQAGEVYGQGADGQAVREGDLHYRVYRPHDIARDFTKDSHEHHDWFVMCDYASRFELAARYPVLAEKILALPTRFEDTWQRRVQSDVPRWECDDVSVYRMVHRQTAAVPQGRMVVFLSDEVVLSDGPLPYERVPLSRVAAGELEGTCFGYSVGFDLNPIGEAFDRLASIALTNQSTYGVQNIASPVGSGVKVTSLADGLNLVEYDPKFGPPTALQLTATPPELFGFMTELNTFMEVVSGVNSVARGQPEDSLKSGAALALVQSMAIQFSLDLQQSYAMLLEEVGTATVSILKTFANTKRVAEIVGKSNRSALVDFTGADLSGVTRVTVDIGNPVLRTTAGKVDLANQMVEMGLVTTAEELITVKTTGQLRPVYEAETAELQLIRAENEGLSEGRPAVGVITDRHDLHIREHRAVLASPEARANPELVQLVAAHINEHVQLLMGMDPGLASILGIAQPVVAPLAAGPGAPAQQPGPGPTGTPLPNQPTNPLTGQRANPIAGIGPAAASGEPQQ